MNYKIFGPTDKKVFSVGLGTYGHGEAYGGITKKESLEILHTAADNITNEANLLIDTAPRYGNGLVETWIGEFLKNTNKKNVFIATKGGRHIEPDRINEKDFNPEFLQKDLDGSLKRLGVDSIFLYQLHNPPLNTILEGSAFAFLEEMRKQGKIQWYGLSIDTAEEGLAAINVSHERGYNGLVSLQVIYNILQKSVLNEICPTSRANDVAIIAREPLLRGFLANIYNLEKILITNLPSAPSKIIETWGEKEVVSKVKKIREMMAEGNESLSLAQAALGFVSNHPDVSVVIPGINRKKYINDDLFPPKMDLSFLGQFNQLTDLFRNIK